MLALEIGDPAPRSLADLHAGHMSIRMAADNVRFFSGQGEKMSCFRQTELPEERTMARRNLKEATLSRRPPAANVSRPQAQDQATRRQHRQSGEEWIHGRILLSAINILASPQCQQGKAPCWHCGLAIHCVRAF